MTPQFKIFLAGLSLLFLLLICVAPAMALEFKDNAYTLTPAELADCAKEGGCRLATVNGLAQMAQQARKAGFDAGVADTRARCRNFTYSPNNGWPGAATL